MSKSLIELKNVTMKFGGVTALSDVTFDVKEKLGPHHFHF
jgi:ABC-type branched-subunit amino acid transport system ATPase component